MRNGGLRSHLAEHSERNGDCRQALPDQLEYPRDWRTLGSDRNHGSIPHCGKDTRRVLPAQARPWHELLGRSRCAVYWWGLNSCMLLLGRRDLVLLPTLHLSAWAALAAVVILLVYKIAVIGW